MSSRPALLRFLRARLRDEAAAEDLLQELWIKLESAPPTGPVAAPESYLFRMANNLVLDMRRAEGRRIRRDEAWSDVQGGGGGDRDRDDRPSAEALLIARERLAAVNRALDSLPERTGQIFRMFRLQEIPQRQIAADLGISVSAIEKHVQRGLKAAAEALRNFDEDSVAWRRPANEKDR